MPEIPYEKIIYNPLKLAYLAGIVDGEGSICIYRVNPAKYNRYQNPSFRGVLNISNTKKELFDWIEKQFSNLNKSKKHRRSIFKKNSTHERWIYEWVVQGHRVIDICTQILPYLVIKKRQAELMIEFRKTFENQKGCGAHTPLDPEIIALREDIRVEMSHLNAKGFLKAEIEHFNSLQTN